MKITSLINWRLFGMLLGLGVLGTLSVFPFLLTVQGEILSQLPMSIPLVIVLSVVQSTVLLSIAVFVGLLLGKKIGLGAPIIEDWLLNRLVKEKVKSVGLLSVKLGVMVGVLIIGFDYIFAFFIEQITNVATPLWQGFLASFYGGFVEEILLRLFLVTLLSWVMWRFSKLGKNKPSSLTIWVAIISAAVIFGVGHLPATAALTEITPLIVFRAVFLNGIGGVVFGWLYWRKGLESAMIAHFTADIILLVVLPFLLSIV